jgi:hypothetical protein
VGVRYSVNGPGSIEHEAQCTFIQGTGGVFPSGAAAACRIDNTGADDWYYIEIDLDDDVILCRLNGASRTALTTFTGGFVNAASDWLTVRIAAAGAIGANTVISLWWQNHGGSKPADPGWIGVDGSPDQTYTDTAVDRLG